MGWGAIVVAGGGVDPEAHQPDEREHAGGADVGIGAPVSDDREQDEITAPRQRDRGAGRDVRRAREPARIDAPDLRGGGARLARHCRIVARDLLPHGQDVPGHIERENDRERPQHAFGMGRGHQQKHVDEDQREIDEKPPEPEQRLVRHRHQVTVPAQNGRQQRGSEDQRLVELGRIRQRAVLHPRHARERRGKSHADRHGEQAPDKVGARLGPRPLCVVGTGRHRQNPRRRDP